MDLGFATIGNATLVVFDGGPLLVTDPWTGGPAYFGSWSLQHEVPEEIQEEIAAAPFVLFSHGHPDHLNPGCLPAFLGRTILLPDHFGGRIADSLRSSGFAVTVLVSDRWTRLSDRVRVLCRPDVNQDAVLLVDVGGTLVVNVNDAQERGSKQVRRIVSRYPASFLLRLSGYGGTDMMNFHDEAGTRLPAPSEIRKAGGYLVGAELARVASAIGTTHVVPFSSLHRYQRSDSAWANQSETRLEDYAQGFRSTTSELLPAYVRYDCIRGSWTAIDPRPEEHRLLAPEVFGDVWSDELDAGERTRTTEYFRSFEHVADHLTFVNLRVGGRDHVIPLRKRGFSRGVTFEVPRNSLMAAVDHRIFDDLLIGNFMKTTLHGRWPLTGLYPDFTPYVAKYGDNAAAYTRQEVGDYLAAYRRQVSWFDYLRATLEQRAAEAFRRRVPRQSFAYERARRAYWRAKSWAAQG